MEHPHAVAATDKTLLRLSTYAAQLSEGSTFETKEELCDVLAQFNTATVREHAPS